MLIIRLTDAEGEDEVHQFWPANMTPGQIYEISTGGCYDHIELQVKPGDEET